MQSRFGIKVFFICLISFASLSFATNPLPEQLIDFSSNSGAVLLKENTTPNTLKLLSHFTTQKTLTYCGVASAVMILNSSNVIPPSDSNHPPYQYFTQEDFFNDKVKAVVSLEEVQREGIPLGKLASAIETFGLKVSLYYANEISLQEFRELLKNALANQDFIIVNFSRIPLNQPGDGHHSPIAAYDQQSDRFLILDVARFKSPPFWVKTEDLWNAVNTKDNNVSRGFLVIQNVHN